MIMVSLCSAFFAVVIYRYFDDAPEVIYRDSSSAMYANYNETILSGKLQRQFLSTAPTNFTNAAEAVTPAVVNIRSNGSLDLWGGGSSGSGVIISPDGYIVTNNHVIEGGRDIEVTLNDNREFSAKLIGTDASTDMALIKISARGLPHLFFGNSDSVRVGEWVLAVGNPFNLESTVTAGIVSAKGRNIDILEEEYKVESFIQTDAAVNPGNSGGALVNTNGELIGINTAIITRSGRYEGYSFAVPANLARKVIRDLKDYGIVQRAILGVNIEDMTDELAKDLGLKAVEGVYINRIIQGSSAEDAGMKRGDVIVGINNIRIKTMPELQEQVARYRPGNKINVEYIRKQKRYQTDVILKNKSNTTELTTIADGSVLEDLGVELRDLSRSEKRQLQVEGVMVKSILRGSKIERTNMDPGFIITKVNEVMVASVDDVIEELENSKGKVLLEGVYQNYPGEWGYTFSK